LSAQVSAKILKFRYTHSATSPQSHVQHHQQTPRPKDSSTATATSASSSSAVTTTSGSSSSAASTRSSSPPRPSSNACLIRPNNGLNNNNNNNGNGGVKKGLFGNKAANDNAKEKTVTSKRTMESISKKLGFLLEGKPYEEMFEFCDFSLNEQNEATTAKGIQPTVNSDEYKPVVKKSVTYIVAAVLFNERGEVLMMQEAKSSCAGQWYLPAGRMEPGEDIVEASKREVLEETGMNFDPTTLILVEVAGGNWYRFVVTGRVTSGKLKTPADADSESLQAKWIADLGELSLRATDVLRLIELGREYRERAPGERWHLPQLPAIRPHPKLFLRLVTLVRKKTDNGVHVLVSEKTTAHLPVCEINPTRSLHSTLKKYMTDIFGSDLPPHRPHGLLSVEHSGKPTHSNDGLCLTLLVSVRVPMEAVCLIDKYSWMPVDKGLGDQLLDRLARNMTVPLTVLR